MFQQESQYNTVEEDVPGRDEHYIGRRMLVMELPAPLVASDGLDDIVLTPPSPGKPIRQHNSPERSKNDLSLDADTTSDRKKTPTGLEGGQRKTYSYMSPISSDTDDIPEMPQRIACADQVRRQSTKSRMKEDEDIKDFASEHQTIGMADRFQRNLEHAHSNFASSDNDDGVDVKSVRCQTPKRKFQPLQHFLGESDLLEWPTDGSSHNNNPRVKKKEGRGSRKAVPFECEVCGRSIQSKAMLKRHMLSHTGEKPFECEECGKKYTSRSNLRIHQLNHSGKMDYACTECGQKFTHLPYLQRHLLRHSGKKIHICEHCGKGFIQKYHLVRHVLIHTKQTPHVCDKCGMSFSRTDYLKVHLRNVHQIDRSTPNGNPEKLYKCETCDKYFAKHGLLETHKRVHTGDTPYSCIICSRQFKQSSHLYSHMNTHSSEKPHACNLCELKFTRKSYLRKHKERVHSGAGDSQST